MSDLTLKGFMDTLAKCPRVEFQAFVLHPADYEALLPSFQTAPGGGCPFIGGAPVERDIAVVQGIPYVICDAWLWRLYLAAATAGHSVEFFRTIEAAKQEGGCVICDLVAVLEFFKV
jgi:hypothetical protein